MSSTAPPSSTSSLLPFPNASQNPHAATAAWKNEQLLHTVLDNMAHGVLMFDRMTTDQRREALAEYERMQAAAEPPAGRSRRLRLR